MHSTAIRSATKLCSLLTLLFFISSASEAQKLNLKWTPREDLNILLPQSVRLYETNGILPDGAKIRAMYATVDLRDRNLRLRAIGSNERRETTFDTYRRHRAILAINGGYFAARRSESLLISDGEVVAPGPKNFTRGAFGLVDREPEIVWPFTDSTGRVYAVSGPIELTKQFPALSQDKIARWHPGQAVGGGPVLIKNGKIRDTSLEEGFGGSHLARHPRTAIGYINKNFLMMMVVDGRQTASAGVTIAELAQIMFEAGCYEAVNLDGGGSSAMVAADEVVNVPTDIPNGNQHSLRKNASALVLTEEIPTVTKDVIVIDTEDDRFEAHGIWKKSNQLNFYGESQAHEAQANKLNKAVFRFNGINSGKYQIASWYTISEVNTTEAVYILHHGKDIDTMRVDQTSYASNGRWNVLGTHVLGDGDYLELVTSQVDGKLIADAVRLVPVHDNIVQSKRGDLRIAVISDLNSGLGSASYEWQVDSIIQRIPRAWQPDIVLCGGDMVAGMGVSDSATLVKMWQGFETHIARPLRDKKIPFAFTIGNHDGLQSHPIERRALVSYWSDPAHQTGLNFVDNTQFPNYYSFVAGDAFVVSWDASSSEISHENLNWLSQQFESDAAKHAKMRIVVGHLPMYSVAQERDSKGNVLTGGDSLRALLEKFNVKVYISGHQHAYYPGKRGKLQLLNTGAAGSGPRRWLTTDKSPVNTVTIMDVFFRRDTIVYTTYDIRHQRLKDMTVFDHRELPAFISGVNGFIIRNDVGISQEAFGSFYAVKKWQEKKYGTVTALVRGDELIVSGKFSPDKKLANANTLLVCIGKHGEAGPILHTLSLKGRSRMRGKFRSSFKIKPGIESLLSAGGIYVVLRIDDASDEFRAQLYPAGNSAPHATEITSHRSVNTYGIRNSKALHRIEWRKAMDYDGDPVSYIYQLASDSLFRQIVIQEYTNGTSAFKRQEKEIFHMIGSSQSASPTQYYHRVVSFDGRNFSASHAAAVRFFQSSEPLAELIEVDPPKLKFEGKIANVGGQGSGATWDNHGKLWLADYSGALHIQTADGKDAAFSPLRSVKVNGIIYPLKPVNGVSVDLDGNILAGCNRHLIKINALTGDGIAVWTVPEGKRSITTPRVNAKGEVYAMSLFAEDPNYVLKESVAVPGTFDLLRTIELPQRILTRTFDMTADGLTLFFPDPGSPVIQSFSSKDGLSYTRGEDIRTVAAGCNAIKIVDTALYATARASGISGSTLHYRDEKAGEMWTATLEALDGSEARGMTVSPDGKTFIICAWDKGGGFYRYSLSK